MLDHQFHNSHSFSIVIIILIHPMEYSTTIITSLFSSFIIIIISLTFSSLVSSTTFTIVNRCDFTIWPATLSSSGSPPLSTTGFELPSGDTHTLPIPPAWSGRLWARTGCNFFNSLTPCVTGDCNSGQIQCNGATAIPPATLAEFTLGNGGGLDYYDVSLVDGFNLPMVVDVSGGGGGGSSGSCQSTGCVADLNRQCPDELKGGAGGEGEGCKSACEAFGKDEYCCSGEFGSPDKCKASVYSQIFKTVCPRAYSYAFDDGSSTFTCGSGGDYRITFCPSLTSQKSSRGLPVVDTAAGSGKRPVEVSTGDGVGVTWLSNMFSSKGSYLLREDGISLVWRLSVTALAAAGICMFTPS